MKMYLGTLYRFGYDLTAIDVSESKVKSAIMREYKRAFIEQNGYDPTKRHIYFDDREPTWYGAAKNDIEIIELEVGKVEWR